VCVWEEDVFERTFGNIVLDISWNNTDRGDLKSNLVQKENLLKLSYLYVTTIEDAVAPQKLEGIFIDNKIGAQVKKRVPHQYIHKFDALVEGKKMKVGSYHELKKPTTFGQQEMFSWAIPLGHRDDFEVVDFEWRRAVKRESEMVLGNDGERGSDATAL
jgi:hypothetical protein